MELNNISQTLNHKPEIVQDGFDNSKMKKDEFLKVLLADIQWQDPLDAKDISDFINNNVKLREMEVFNTFESSLKNLNVANSSNSLLLASNLIGKKIKYEGSETFIQNGKGTVEFKLKQDADFVKVTITDKNGQIVETKSFNNLKGNQDYPFEIDNSSLEDGYYKVYVEATKGEEKVETTILSEGLADGVVKEDGKIKILFGNTELDIDKIVQIGG